MQVNRKRVLVCDCEKTMRIDGRALARALDSDEPAVQTQLCRAQIEAFETAAADETPLLVCCTQESPLFSEVAAETGGSRPAYVNIRERAGWSDEGGRATAKMAALIAEAALDIEPTPAIELESRGVALVYGSGQAALDAAHQLAGRLNVTCLLAGGEDPLPASVIDVPVFRGRIRSARGRLGAFELTVDGFAAYQPSSRSGFAFPPGQEGAVSRCDVLVDLSGGTPLFPAPDQRDGYVRAEPSDAVAVQKALFAAADLVGTFEKPRYLRVDPTICAHKRNEIVGCDLCLTVCPTGAVQPAGDHTAVDAAICSGHGACASVCPTGAIVFDLPRGNALFERLRTLLRTYRTAGGTEPVLLVHDPRRGEETIALLSRLGRGLPANVLPFAVNEITMVGLDFLLLALAYGAGLGGAGNFSQGLLDLTLDATDLRTSGRALFYASVLLRMKSDHLLEEPDEWDEEPAEPMEGFEMDGAAVDPFDALEAEMDRRLDASVAAVASSFGFGLARSGFTAGASLAVEPEEQGRAAGLTTATAGLGFLIAPVTGLWLYQTVMPSAPFQLNAVLALAGLLLWWRGRHAVVRQRCDEISVVLSLGNPAGTVAAVDDVKPGQPVLTIWPFQNTERLPDGNLPDARVVGSRFAADVDRARIIAEYDTAAAGFQPGRHGPRAGNDLRRRCL